MICKECGASNSKSQKTCSNCHAPLKHESFHKNTTQRRDPKKNGKNNNKGRNRYEDDDY